MEKLLDNRFAIARRERNLLDFPTRIWYNVLMLQTHIDPERALSNVGISLATTGVFLFAYGALMTTPTLRDKVLPLPAQIETIAPLHSAAPLRKVPSSVFLAGSLLLVSAATVDVWRRLGKV